VHVLRRRSARRDERGAVLILGALFASVAIVAAALSIDIGSLVLRKRTNQRVADLASLDGVRGLEAAAPQRPVVESLAVASAGRNGFTVDPATRTCPFGASGATYTADGGARWMRIEVGKETATGFQPTTCPAVPLLEALFPVSNDAVRVYVSSPVSFDFMPGGGRETASGVSTLAVNPGTPGTPGSSTPASNGAAVRVGSTAVSINATQASLLNAVFQTTGNPVGTPLGNPPGNLAITALGYQGLAGVNVSLEELATQLGISAGTVDQVVNAGFGYDDLLTATAVILDRNNQDAASATVSEIYSRTIPLDFDARHQNINLSQLVNGVSGNTQTFNGSTVAQTEVNVLELLRGAAVLADGDHLLTVPLTGTVPLPTGATVASANVQIIEAAQSSAWGPAIQTADTAQLRTTLSLTVPVSVVGLGVLNIVVPVSIDGGGATATMTGINCQPAATVPDSVVAQAQTRALSAQTGAWSVSALLNTVTISGAAGSVVSTPLSSGGPWTYPPDFTALHSVSPAGLPGLTVSASSITVGGLLPLGVTAATVTSTIANTLNSVLAQLNSTIMPTLYSALGVGFGSADVSILNSTNSTTPPSCTPGTTVASVPPTPDSYGDLPVLTE
jgi:uncharacterized membrane protein